eukprot:TRINITY_DN4807_c0_g1_i3.p1 TRINITY_DN4807_c0_g1~~TRINITY_DN4807_c0_g1_i3.p1  ORF type:complete len:292 (+),score=63.08 TRINITY_DN4807_c0_g1_i3:137-1012(+)
MYGDGSQLKVMFVGGPNQRTDYHVEDGEELFYMIRGQMHLPIVSNGVFTTVTIKEGELFLLPGHIPHSPQRHDNTIGWVIERERFEGEQDKLRWYCQQCRGLMYQATFACTDLGTQLKPAIEGFHAWRSEKNHTCPRCSNRALELAHATNGLFAQYDNMAAELIDGNLPAVDSGVYPAPFSLQERLDNASRERTEGADKPSQVYLYPPTTQFKVYAYVGVDSIPTQTKPYQVWIWQVRGSLALKLEEESGDREVVLPAGHCYVLPANTPYSIQLHEDCQALVVERGNRLSV